ncbi:MAG: dTDP-4-dehydrorhamnose reductase [Deltaproteobacteria bacterium]|nr:dTDP-4-dehydrorhamnose reductase [Deltaproteobacteria bacterium]
MRIMVTGAHGQVGWELSKRGKRKGFDILGLDRATLDITDQSVVKRRVEKSEAVLVVNGAAYTAVDQAESEPELAFAANRDGPANLASACAEAGIPLIHLSTDFVFDGEKKGPYLESDQVSPLNVYGKSKAAGETAVRERLAEHIILRTSWVYSERGGNFVKSMIRLGRERDVIRVVADQYGCPTYAADLADTILIIAVQIQDNREIAWGTYHYCGKGVASWHGLALETLSLAKQYTSLKVKTIEAIGTADYPTPAKRPLNSVLDCSLMEKTFDIHQKPWQQSLARMIKRMFSV